jgi:hypothetical protein
VNPDDDDDNEDEILHYCQNISGQLNTINRNHDTLMQHEGYFRSCGANPELNYIMTLVADVNSLFEVVKDLRDTSIALERVITRQKGHGYWYD